MDYYGLDPENLHICVFCQHHAYDLDKGNICLKGVVDGRMHLQEVNDCESWKTAFENDFRRRHDLERQLEKEQRMAKDKQLKLQL